MTYLKWFDFTDFEQFPEELRTLWIKAAKDYIDEPKDKRFGAWYQWAKYYYEGKAFANVPPLQWDEYKVEKQVEALQTARELWDEAMPLQGGEWQHLINSCTKVLRDRDILVDPEYNDETIFSLWQTIVPMDVQNGIFFKDMTGNGFVYSESEGLWREMEIKQIIAHVHRMFQVHVKADKFRWSSEDVKKTWSRQMGNVATYNGFLTLLRGSQSLPHPYEEKLDAWEWAIPIGDRKVFDCKEGKAIEREIQHYFTKAAPFMYLSNYTNAAGEIINDAKKREELINAVRKKVNFIKLLSLLWDLFPNAMQFVEQSFKDPARLWFIVLRLGAFLSGYCTRESLFVYGKGKGGKSTLFQTIISTVGDLGIILGKLSFIKSKNDSAGAHNTDRMRAVRKRACLVDELESTDHMNESLIKNWVSHQILPAREIYGKQQEIRMKSSLTFLTNEPPKFSTEDVTIQERILAIKVTTKFFDENCDKNEKPSNFTIKSEWKDGYSKQEDVHWMYRTKESWEQSLSFLSNEEKKNELGSFLCICARIAYIIVMEQGNIQLPTPDIVFKDKKTFFSQSDVVDQFVKEYYERETDKKSAATLKEVYAKFTEVWKDYGIKHFTLQAFKNNLNAKNLLLEVGKKKAQKVKLKLKKDDSRSFYSS